MTPIRHIACQRDASQFLATHLTEIVDAADARMRDAVRPPARGTPERAHQRGQASAALREAARRLQEPGPAATGVPGPGTAGPRAGAPLPARDPLEAARRLFDEALAAVEQALAPGPRSAAVLRDVAVALHVGILRTLADTAHPGAPGPETAGPGAIPQRVQFPPTRQAGGRHERIDRAINPPGPADTVHRVLLAGGLALFREGVRSALLDQPDLRVVSEAASVTETVAVARATRPDLVLLDGELPRHQIGDTTARVRAVAPRCRILMLTVDDDLDLARWAVAAGASGYLAKSATRDELVCAVRAACRANGHAVLTVSLDTLEKLQRPAGSVLSPREAEVLSLAARALSNAGIARELFISEGTVKRHLANSYTKLSAVSRIDAINKAAAAGLLSLP